ncbi:hypothetical protein BDV95DRAFT_448779, partial [Massariosphaeria phaeospora]
NLRRHTKYQHEPFRLYACEICRKEYKRKDALLKHVYQKHGTDLGVNRDETKRINEACDSCRERKLRCDGSRPTCGTCKRLTHDCTY